MQVTLFKAVQIKADYLQTIHSLYKHCLSIADYIKKHQKIKFDNILHTLGKFKDFFS